MRTSIAGAAMAIAVARGPVLAAASLSSDVGSPDIEATFSHPP